MSIRLAIALLAPVVLLAQAAPPTASPCENTPVYSPCELTFDLPAQDASAGRDPYTGIDLKIEFRSPGFRTHALAAYWDGGSRVAVRFAPTEAGKWDYRVTSNIAAWNGREGSFTAAASDAPGFVRPAEMHHWTYTERNLAHLWMGVTELGFAAMDDAAFRGLADARAAQKFNHFRGLILGAGGEAVIGPDGRPNAAYFQRLDRRIRYLNQKGMVADLILAPRPSDLAKLFPDREKRRRFTRYLAARYSAMNITWHGVQRFEDEPGSRALLKELGTALKDSDPYGHPRTSGAGVTSAPLLGDGWMDFVEYGPDAGDAVGAVEHQLYPVPFVRADLGRETDAAAFRHRLWNATMDGQYPTYNGAGVPSDSPGARAMTAWFDFFSGMRHWELEPYFDVEGGRALALEDTDYIVYVEKPGPVELIVEKHSYKVTWMNPADGQTVEQKKEFKGDHFTGQPPDNSHDWVLRLVRPGSIEKMARSYYFESRSSEEGSRALPVALQIVESNPERVPFQIVHPTGDLSISKASPYEAKITRQTRATGAMTWLWTGEVTSEGEGYRVLATGQKGEMRAPAAIAAGAPATLLIRVYGMNANGKVYELNQACRIVP